MAFLFNVIASEAWQPQGGIFAIASPFLLAMAKAIKKGKANRFQFAFPFYVESSLHILHHIPKHFITIINNLFLFGRSKVVGYEVLINTINVPVKHRNDQTYGLLAQ